MTWSAKAERGSDCLIRLIAWVARKTGRRFCRLLLYPIVAYFMLVDRVARRASHEFLRLVKGRPARTPEVFAHLYSFAATLLDRVYLAQGELHRFEIIIENQELVSRALEGRRGCVLLGSHLGSFDLMALTTRSINPPPPLAIMMRMNPSSRLRRIAGIDDTSLNIIPLGTSGSFLQAYDVVTQGGIVAILADRVEGSSSLAVPFLGKLVPMPVAPHILAARSEAPMLMCFALYEGGNRYRIKFLDAGPTAAVSSRGNELKPMVEKYAAVLEQQARLYPLNWFNFYPYWENSGDKA